MTFQRLCNLVTKGDYNYHSRVFDILIEPMHSDSQLSFRVTAIKNNEPVESIELEPPTGDPNWEKRWTADSVRDKILTAKQQLHTKYIIHG